MQSIRHIFEYAPESVPVPEKWQQKRVEVILLGPEAEESTPNTTHAWPADYFEQTFGSIPDFPEQAQEFAEIREPME